MPPHQIVHRLARERISIIFLPQPGITVNAQPAGRRRPVRHFEIIIPLRQPARRMQAVGIRIRRHIHIRRRCRHPRVPARRRFRQRIVPEQIRVVTAEPVVPVIPHPSLLRLPARRLDHSRLRMETKIPAPCVHLPRLHLRPKDPARSVNPSIQSEAQTVDPRVVVIRRPAAVFLHHLIRFAIPIGIPGKKNIRRGTHENPVPPAH